MSDHRLTPDKLKQKHAAEIQKSATFETHGISEQEAKSFLEARTGDQYRQSLESADPSAHSEQIRSRAIDHFRTGSQPPTGVISEEPLYKIVPSGTKPSRHSPFFTTRAEIEAAYRSGYSLADRFGLPITSESLSYDLYRITPNQPATVYISRVAPTSELGGLVTRNGGGEQRLVPNRNEHTPAELVSKHLDDNLTITLNRVGDVRARGPAFIGSAIKGASAAGAATVVYDVASTSLKLAELSRQRNVVAVQSQVLRFATGQAGGLGGAIVGAQYGARLGMGSGPGVALATTAGAVVGAIGGGVIAQRLDHERIYRQRDREGHVWRLDPDHPEHGWTRTESRPDPQGTSFLGLGQPTRTVTLQAYPELASELDYQASSTAAQLGLVEPPLPQAPFSLAASVHDTPSAIPSTWERETETGRWSRRVIDHVLEHGLKVSHVEMASPSRAEELDQQARTVIEENVRQSPTGIVERYIQAYQAHGWSAHGPVPEAITLAKRTARHQLTASDGNTYRLDREDAWVSRGLFGQTTRATPTIRAELDATWRLQDVSEPRAPIAAPLASAIVLNPRQSPADSPPTQVGSESRAPVSDFEARIDRMLAAADRNDWDSFRQDRDVFAAMPAYRELEAHTQQLLDLEVRLTAEKQQAVEQARQEWAQQQVSEHQRQKSHGMSR